jgi:Holliday junction resolvase RusA-like endonuclease
LGLTEARLLVEFCVVGPPVSAQARKKRNLDEWRKRVAEAARQAWPGELPPHEGDVDLTVTYYHLGKWRGDNDNMLKPIQDSLQGTVYVNDRQVRNHAVRQRDLKGKYTVHRISMVLARAFSDGSEFLHIRVEQSAAIEDLG